MSTKRGQRESEAIARRAAEFTWTRWLLDTSSVRGKPIEAKKAEYLAFVEYFASQGFWSHYVTHYWARLMERVRASCCEDRNTYANLPFMAAVLGTLMLTCVAMLPEDNWFVFGDWAWAESFKIKERHAHLIKNKILKILGYDLELSKWTMAMDKIERAALQTPGLDEKQLLGSDLEKAVLMLEESRRNRNKRGADNAARDCRRLKRSLAKIKGDVIAELQVVKEAKASVSFALHPIFSYYELAPLEFDLSMTDLQIEMACLSIN